MKFLKEERDRLSSERSTGDKLITCLGGNEKDQDVDAANDNEKNGDDSGINSGASDNLANNCDNNKKRLSSSGAGDSSVNGAVGGAGTILQNGVERMDDEDEFEDDDDDDEEEDNDGDDEDDGDRSHLNVDEPSGRRPRKSGGILGRARRLKIKTTPPPPQK